MQDDGEPGVAGVTVRLLGAGDVVVATTTTDGAGIYRFDQLTPGTYRLEFVPPADHTVTDRDAGTDDTADSDVDPGTRRTVPTQLVGGEDDRTWDLGVYRPASLGDEVWVDDDLDGVRDAGEPPVAGVTVLLVSAAGASLDSTTTDADGRYGFTGLRPGGYVVQFVAPDGYTFTRRDAAAVLPNGDEVDSDADPTTGQTGVVELSSGEHDPTIDAGLVRRASLGDRVWDDRDADGLQDADEPGVPGVVVTLYDCAGVTIGAVPGAAVDSTVTDDEGRYGFGDLLPGSWAIGVSNLPTGSAVSPADASPDGDDAVDSDADPATGRTVCTELEPGEDDPTWDVGIDRSADSGVVPPDTEDTSTITTTTPATVAGLPVTGGNVAQLLVFAAALVLIGLVLVRARRPRTL